jgi:hypothetical protein
MHASIACLLLYEDYVWVSLGNAMKAKQSKAKHTLCLVSWDSEVAAAVRGFITYSRKLP